MHALKIYIVGAALLAGTCLAVYIRQQNSAQEEIARRQLQTESENRILMEAVKRGIRENQHLFSTAPLYPQTRHLPITQHFRAPDGH